jgi:iron-sulfur cluster assembly protein
MGNKKPRIKRIFILIEIVLRSGLIWGRIGANILINIRRSKMKQPVSLTEAAVRRILRLAPSPSSGLRLELKKGGCAGMEYSMTVAEGPLAGDLTVEQGGAKLFLAPMTQMYLFGTEIDYQESLLEAGFVFRNPNVVSACGCGESVSFGS